MHLPKCLLPFAYYCLWLLLHVEVVTEAASNTNGSTGEAAGCSEIPAATGQLGGCNSGNNLLQLASKPSRSRSVTAPTDEDDSPSDTDSSSQAVGRTSVQERSSEISSSSSAKFREAAPEAQAIPKASKVVVTEDMLEVARIRANLLDVLHRMRHSLETADQTRSIFSISIFALICLIGMCILCAIVNLQSDSRMRVARVARVPSASPAARLLAKHGQGSAATVSSPQVRGANSPPSSNVVLSTGAASSQTLCSGLVVPANSDCVLVVRMLPQLFQVGGADIGDAAAGAPQAGGCAVDLEIFDLEGKPVLLASVVQPWPKPAAATVTLKTWHKPRSMATDNRWLAMCRAGGSGNNKSVHIYDKDDVLFGSLQKDATPQQRYVLNNSAGDLLLLFEGTFEEHRVNILDARRSMIAHAEPCKMAFEPDGRFYQARIAAGVDVGLVLSGLLSINAMEAL